MTTTLIIILVVLAAAVVGAVYLYRRRARQRRREEARKEWLQQNREKGLRVQSVTGIAFPPRVSTLCGADSECAPGQSCEDGTCRDPKTIEEMLLRGERAGEPTEGAAAPER